MSKCVFADLQTYVCTHPAEKEKIKDTVIMALQHQGSKSTRFYLQNVITLIKNLI
jgi:hypothetical protein